MGQGTAKAIDDDLPPNALVNIVKSDGALPPEILEVIMQAGDARTLYDLSLTNYAYRGELRNMLLRYHLKNVQATYDAWMQWDPRKEGPLPSIPALEIARHVNDWLSLEWLAQGIGWKWPDDPLFGHLTQGITREQRELLLLPLYDGRGAYYEVPLVTELTSLLLNTEIEYEWTWPRLFYHIIGLFEAQEYEQARNYDDSTDPLTIFLSRLCSVWAQPAVIAAHILVVLKHRLYRYRDPMRLRQLLFYVILTDKLHVDVSGWEYEWSLYSQPGVDVQMQIVAHVEHQWPLWPSLGERVTRRVRLELVHMGNDFDAITAFLLRRFYPGQLRYFNKYFPPRNGRQPSTLAGMVDLCLKTGLLKADYRDMPALESLPRDSVILKSIAVLLGHHLSILFALQRPPRVKTTLDSQLRRALDSVLVTYFVGTVPLDVVAWLVDHGPAETLHQMVIEDVFHTRRRPGVNYDTGWPVVERGLVLQQRFDLSGKRDSSSLLI